MNSVSEKIDERILRLLGLEDVFDLDYDTYLTLLKEEIVKGANKLPQEELALLANERKRIRGKKGRFKPKGQKITADKVATTKLLKGSKQSAILPAVIAKPDIQQQDLTGIGKPLQSIAKTLADFLNFKKKTGEEERRDKETQRRTKREEGLEGLKKGISAVSGAAKKMLAPFQDIIDRIWRFIFFTLLGRAFTQLMDWLGDPANKRKIEVLGRFLKDWWPALATAYGLFATPFGKFVRSTLKLLRGFIPRIARFMLAHPVVFGTLLATGAGAVAGFSLEKNLKNVDEKLLQRRIQESKDKGKPLSKQQIEKIRIEQLQKRVQDIQGTSIPGSALLASGGVVPRFSMGGINFGTGYDGIDGRTGERVSGFGPDTQAIIAQPGEIVINKKTVDAVGADHFLALNRMHGGPGANKPKMGRLYNTGGIVQKFNSGGIVGGGVIKLQGGGSPIVNYNLPRELGGGDRLNKIVFNPTYDPQKYQGGGLIGGLDNIGRSVFENVGGTIGRNRGRELGLPGGGFLGEKLGEREGRKRYEELLRPLRKQGGGLINPGSKELNKLETKADRLIEQNFPRTYAEYMEQVKEGRVQPMSPEDMQSEIEKQKRNKKMEMIREFLQYQQYGKKGYNGGGLIKENTGVNIPGATADRQLAALQPGEYVLPIDTVNRLGTSLIDKLVASTDSNSNPFKKSVNKPRITPLSRGNMQGMMTLPPITQSASGGMTSSAAGSKVPSFSAASPSGGAERSMNASIYGIVG